MTHAFDMIMSIVLIAAVLGVFDLVMQRLGFEPVAPIPPPVTLFSIVLVVLALFLTRC